MKRLVMNGIMTFVLLITALVTRSFAAEPAVTRFNQTMASHSVTNIVSGAASDLVLCKDPRPEICYEVFNPVCAVRNTPKHCLAEPCLPQQTFANDCKACAEPDVIGFRPNGECR